MMADVVKQMASWNCDIKPYVVFGTITAEQYKEYTGRIMWHNNCLPERGQLKWDHIMYLDYHGLN